MSVDGDDPLAGVVVGPVGQVVRPDESALADEELGAHPARRHTGPVRRGDEPVVRCIVVAVRRRDLQVEPDEQSGEFAPVGRPAERRRSRGERLASRTASEVVAGLVRRHGPDVDALAVGVPLDDPVASRVRDGDPVPIPGPVGRDPCSPVDPLDDGTARPAPDDPTHGGVGDVRQYASVGLREPNRRVDAGLVDTGGQFVGL
ncbi:MAG: hypothetical protein ABEJ05_11645 [Haloglomus sp.]